MFRNLSEKKSNFNQFFSLIKMNIQKVYSIFFNPLKEFVDNHKKIYIHPIQTSNTQNSLPIKKNKTFTSNLNHSHKKPNKLHILVRHKHVNESKNKKASSITTRSLYDRRLSRIGYWTEMWLDNLHTWLHTRKLHMQRILAYCCIWGKRWQLTDWAPGDVCGFGTCTCSGGRAVKCVVKGIYYWF